MSSGRRFESLTDEDLEKLIESKDTNNTKQIVHFRGNSLLGEISKSMTVNLYSKNTVKV
jgi:hypothetical protein